MYRLLIVDDEFNIRDGFAKAIPWNQYDVEIAGTAINGLDALEKIQASKPDIVITDIYMDVMDGLELIEKIKEDYPDIKVIIISGYDDFEYAKKAIDLKVFTYLLKPILPRQLVEAVCSVIDEIQADRRLEEKMSLLEERIRENYALLRDSFLKELVEGRITGREELQRMEDFLSMHFGAGSYCCAIFTMDAYQELYGNHSPKEAYMIMLGVREIIEEILTSGFKSFTLMYKGGSILSLIGREKSGSMEVSCLYDSLEKIKSRIRMFFNQTVTIGIGGYTEDILKIGKVIHEAEKALDYKITVGKDSIIHIDDVASMDREDWHYPFELEGRIVNSLYLGDKKSVTEALNVFFGELGIRNHTREEIRTAVLQLFSVMASKLMDKGFNLYKTYDKNVVDPVTALDRFETLEEIKNWMTNIVLYAIDEMYRNIRAKAKNIILKAQDYIRQNYTNPDISLVSIADHIYMNPSYFSKMYKEETGETYIEFLTRLRLDNAKRLLKDSHMKVVDIGSAVGYQNINYFCTLFRKCTGCSPIEYRGQQILNG